MIYLISEMTWWILLNICGDALEGCQSNLLIKIGTSANTGEEKREIKFPYKKKKGLKTSGKVAKARVFHAERKVPGSISCSSSGNSVSPLKVGKVKR